jgi:hypothetical protein
MKTCTYLILTLFLVFLFFIPRLSFAGSGRFTKVDDDGNMGYLVVEVSGRGTLWVGCTVFPAGFGKYEVDLDAKKVTNGGTVKFNFLPKMRAGNTALDYVVALWEDKISLRKCEKIYGKNSERCKWARGEMGYQMEGRLDRRQGTYKSGFD